jgi:hypothetical protein
MIKGIGKTADGQGLMFIGLDVRNVDLLMRDCPLRIRAEPQNGLPLDIVIFYGRRQDDMIETLIECGVELPDIVERHDIDEEQERG